MTRKHAPTRSRPEHPGGVSLISVALPYRSAGDAREPPPAKPPPTALAQRYRGKGVRGKPWTNLKKLARAHCEEAIETLAELTGDANPCVRLGASKLLVKIGSDENRGGGKAGAKHKAKKLNVKIRRM